MVMIMKRAERCMVSVKIEQIQKNVLPNATKNNETTIYERFQQTLLRVHETDRQQKKNEVKKRIERKELV